MRGCRIAPRKSFGLCVTRWRARSRTSWHDARALCFSTRAQPSKWLRRLLRSCDQNFDAVPIGNANRPRLSRNWPNAIWSPEVVFSFAVLLARPLIRLPAMKTIRQPRPWWLRMLRRAFRVVGFLLLVLIGGL